LYAVPAAQAVQWEFAEPSAYVPAPQLSQIVRPAVAENVPGPQESQSSSLSWLDALNVDVATWPFLPAAQAVHTLALPLENLPLSHDLHGGDQGVAAVDAWSS
jgi:hypothetical protein